MITAIRRRETPSLDQEQGRQEAVRLASLVRECITSGIAREACVVRLSRLPSDRVRPHHVRLARAALEPLAHADRARLFELPNHDLVAIWRGPADAALQASRRAVTLLFDDMPELLPEPAETSAAEAPAATPEPVWEEFHLPEQSDRLLTLADGSLAGKPDPQAEPPPPAQPLDTQALAALEACLARADVARFARRRQICARLPDGGFRLRWEKRYLSVDEITTSLAPGHAVRSDPWLFRRLTRTLDRRMLALLAAPGELADAGPFSINLNVSSILAPEFLRLDNALPMALRGQVVLDLLPADILADPPAFVFARDFAQSRGYRLLLRGVTADLLPVFQLGRIGLDLMQLRWSPAVAAIGPDIVLADAPSVVLSQADAPEAIDWGLAHGCTLFQGKMAVPQRMRAPR